MVTREWPAEDRSKWHVAPSTIAYFTIAIYTAALFAREDTAHLLGEDLLVSAGTLAFLGLFFLGTLRVLRRWGCLPSSRV